MNRDDFLKNLWRWKIGLPDLPPKKIPTKEEVYAVQWCPEFEQLMRNRLWMGYFRYQPLSEQPKGKYKNMESAEKRLNLWKKTGNDELLVDIANLCMVEYMKGVHPNKHFKSEDDGEHVST